jgi:hypothetical protein
MRTFKLFFVLASVWMMTFSCSAQSEKSGNKPQVQNAGPVEVFYFHFTRRCVTCQAIESQTRQIISELYGDNVSFNAFNLDEADGSAKGKEMGVEGQTLLIVNSGTKINLTNEGFLYARNDPEKFRLILKEKIDPLL